MALTSFSEDVPKIFLSRLISLISPFVTCFERYRLKFSLEYITPRRNKKGEIVNKLHLSKGKSAPLKAPVLKGAVLNFTLHD